MNNFQKGSGDNTIIYPMIEMPKNPCRLVNPKIGKSHGFKIPDNFNLKDSTNEILRVRLEVEKNIFPMEFMQKHYPFKNSFGAYVFPMEIAMIEGLTDSTPKECAKIVHMDSPSDMPRTALKWLTHPDYGQNQNVKDWTKNHINFLETIPYVEEQISDGVKKALNKAFEMKYYFGLVRPEEYFSLQTSVEGHLMTAYEEGCPNHPAFPAGHASAAAGGLTWLIREFPKLTDIQLKTIIDWGYSWAMFRSFAGVHHAIDNISGLMANGFEKYMDKDVVNMYKTK